jgi:thiol-activated cytolysin
MITSAKATKQEAEATLDYKSTGKKVTADLQEKYENIAKNSVFKAIVLGGGSGSADVIMGDTEKIKEVLIQGIVFSKSNPAYPLSYTVADLKTRATSQCRLTTKYIETNCQTLYDRTITFKHTGGFVANFHITWNEYDKLSKTVVTKTWFSNDQTAPYEYMLTFPGDASDFHVEARYAIWIKTWRSKFLNFPVLAKDNTIVNLHGPTWDCKMEAW